MKRTMNTPSSSTGASSANSLCRQVGHEWDPDTISPNYRRCVRSQCKAAERLVNGAWIAVQTTVRRPSQRAACPSQQGMLFAPPPAASLPTRDEERRAEQRYYRLLGR